MQAVSAPPASPARWHPFASRAGTARPGEQPARPRQPLRRASPAPARASLRSAVASPKPPRAPACSPMALRAPRRAPGSRTRSWSAPGWYPRLLDALGAFTTAPRGSSRCRNGLSSARQLKTALVELHPNLRRNALRRSRAVQRSLNEQMARDLPSLHGPARAAENSARGTRSNSRRWKLAKETLPTPPPSLLPRRRCGRSAAANPPLPRRQRPNSGGLLADLTDQQVRTRHSMPPKH